MRIMRHALTAAALTTALAAGSCPEGSSAVLRDAAIANIEALNAAGVDPLEMTPRQMAIASAGCALATTVVTVYDATVPDAPEAVRDFCVAFLKAGQDALDPPTE